MPGPAFANGHAESRKLMGSLNERHARIKGGKMCGNGQIGSHCSLQQFGLVSMRRYQSMTIIIKHKDAVVVQHLLVAMMMMPSCFSTSVRSMLTWLLPCFSLSSKMASHSSKNSKASWIFASLHAQATHCLQTCTGGFYVTVCPTRMSYESQLASHPRL